MELVSIDQSDHAVLRRRADDVSFPLNAEVAAFVRDFFAFFSSLQSPMGKPAGLAAPQVGHGFRVIIIQVPAEAKKLRRDVHEIMPPTVLINPSYLPLSTEITKDWEGCYSVPNRMGEVYRYKKIAYSAFTPQAEKIEGIATGFLARLLQHEIGHLNGELYIDLLKPDCRFGELNEMLEIRKQEMMDTNNVNIKNA